jgi:hypothetical protein
MQPWIKRCLTAVIGLALLMVTVAAFGFWHSDRRMNRVVEVKP